MVRAGQGFFLCVFPRRCLLALHVGRSRLAPARQPLVFSSAHRLHQGDSHERQQDGKDHRKNHVERFGFHRFTLLPPAPCLMTRMISRSLTSTRRPTRTPWRSRRTMSRLTVQGLMPSRAAASRMLCNWSVMFAPFCPIVPQTAEEEQANISALCFRPHQCLQFYDSHYTPGRWAEQAMENTVIKAGILLVSDPIQMICGRFGGFAGLRPLPGEVRRRGLSCDDLTSTPGAGTQCHSLSVLLGWRPIGLRPILPQLSRVHLSLAALHALTILR